MIKTIMLKRNDGCVIDESVLLQTIAIFIKRPLSLFLPPKIFYRHVTSKVYLYDVKSSTLHPTFLKVELFELNP